MSAILKAPVGLLWFGGIGTYVRAASESDEQVGDRANDAIRIAGGEVRAKVIGEGANLGMTQRGRIEAARAGVRLNTDAIDNSAGVNTSDVEVNIKIGLAVPERDGRLTEEDRNALLVEMTDDVAKLVLRNNFLQTLALSLSERRGVGDLGFARRLMHMLEAQGRLDRAIEYLPDDAALTERARRGEALTRPELAVLLAYAKLSLHDELLDSPVPDDPYLGKELERYFPAAMRERFPDAVANHRLRREIIATQLANAIINRGGATMVARLVDQTGRRCADDRRRLCGDAGFLRLGRSQHRDRCARRRSVGRGAAQTLWRSSGLADEPYRVVHPQRRFHQAIAGRYHRDLFGRDRRSRTRPAQDPVRRGAGAMARAHERARRAGNARPILPAAWRPFPIWSPHPTSC